jgi:hypothetical protein
MAGVAEVIRGQWTCYWRGVRLQSARDAGSHGVIVIIAGIFLLKYVYLLQSAAVDLMARHTVKFESLLGGIFLAWMFPLVGNARHGIDRRWLHLPLSFQEIFRIRVVSALIPLSSWLVVVVTLTMFYPVAFAQNRIAGVVSLVLFIILSWLSGLTASYLAGTLGGRRVLFGVVLFIALTAGATTLKNSVAASLWPWLWAVLPPHLVAMALVGTRPWTTLALLTIITFALFWLALWSLKKSLLADPSDSSWPRFFSSAFAWPGKFGSLAIKDFRHYRRLLDLYFGLLAGVLCCAYLISAKTPEPEVVWVFLILFFLFTSISAFNFFGLDGPNGFDRYTLLPLNGRMIILSKNLGFGLLVAVQLLPLLFLSYWRFGLFVASLTLLEAANMTLAYMVWGNWMSIRFPQKLRLNHFSSTGPLPEAIMGLVVGSLPGVLGVFFLAKQQSGVARKVGLVLVVCVLAYAASLVLFGKQFEQRRERIKESLS